MSNPIATGLLMSLLASAASGQSDETSRETRMPSAIGAETTGPTPPPEIDAPAVESADVDAAVRATTF